MEVGQGPNWGCSAIGKKLLGLLFNSEDAVSMFLRNVFELLLV
jgi:hypothetical protein